MHAWTPVSVIASRGPASRQQSYMWHCRVIAACRNPGQATQLAELEANSSGRLEIMQLDCTDEASIAKAAAQVSATHKHLDLLLNVAGILHIPGKMSPGDCGLPNWCCGEVHAPTSIYIYVGRLSGAFSLAAPTHGLVMDVS